MPLGRKRRDYSRFDEDPLVKSARPAKASSATLLLPHIMTPTELADKATRLFAPDLSPVQRRDRSPGNPLYALRVSLLPPPAAELDERPRERTRRFKLFSERTPELRICLLDPRRRCHLVRWRPFAVPSNHSAAVPVRGDARRLSPRGPHIPREPFGVLPAPVPPVPPVPEADSNTSPEERQGKIAIATPPSPLTTTKTPKARPARLQRNRAQRHEWRRELQQHLWVLDMEYERRFRAAMNRQMDAMTDWQDANMVNLFRSIREEPQLYNILGITPVRGHVEAIEALDAENEQRLVRKDKRKKNREQKEKGENEPGAQAETAQQSEQTPPESEDDLSKEEHPSSTTVNASQSTPMESQTGSEPPTDAGSTAESAAAIAENGSDASSTPGSMASAKQSKQAVLHEILGPTSSRIEGERTGSGGTQLVPAGPTATDVLIDSILDVPFAKVMTSIGKHELLGDLLDQLHRLEAEGRALEQLGREVSSGRARLIVGAPAAEPSTAPGEDDAELREIRESLDRSEKQREDNRAHKRRRERKHRAQASDAPTGETSGPTSTDAAQTVNQASGAGPAMAPSTAAPPSEVTTPHAPKSPKFDPDDFKLVFPDLLAKLRVSDIIVRDDEPALPRPKLSRASSGTATLEAVVEEEESANIEDSEINRSTAYSSTCRRSGSETPRNSSDSFEPLCRRGSASPTTWTWRGELYRDQDTLVPSGTSSPA